jgi:hypothetical protein
MTTKQPQIVNVEKAAEMLGCSRQNVLYLLAHERLVGWKVNGKCWVVDVASVEAHKIKRA